MSRLRRGVFLACFALLGPAIARAEGSDPLPVVQVTATRIANHKKAGAYDQPAEWPDRELPVDVIPAEAGMNRFAWDLGFDDPTPIPGAVYSGEGPRGPLVNPGHYRVRMTAKGRSLIVPLVVRLDPRIDGKATAEDLDKVRDLALKVYADNDALHRTVNEIREVRVSLDKLRKWIGADSAGKDVLAAADGLEAKMAPVEQELIQVEMKASEDNLRFPNKLNEQYDSFTAVIDSNDFAPTESQLRVYAELHGRLGAEIARWRELARVELAALNDLMRARGVPKLGIAAGG